MANSESTDHLTLSKMPADICLMLAELLVSSTGIRQALSLRLVNKSFKNMIEGAICDLLLLLERGEARQPLPASIITRMILQKCNSDDSGSRPLCRAIEQTVELKRNLQWSSAASDDACRYNLAAAAAGSLFSCDVVSSLRPSASLCAVADPCSVLVAVMTEVDVRQLTCMEDIGLQAIQETRFFGCVLASAARLGLTEIFNLILDNIDLSQVDTAEERSLNSALKEAAAFDRLDVLCSMTTRLEGSSVSLSYDVAVKSALRNQHERAAMALLRQHRPSPDFEQEILRLAAGYGCSEVIKYLQLADFGKPKANAVNLSLETACRHNQTHVVHLLCEDTQVALTTDTVFWAAYYGNHEVLDLLRRTEPDQSLMVDALAGACLGERLDTIRHIINSPTQRSPMIRGGFAEATHLLLDSKCDAAFYYERAKKLPSLVNYNTATYDISLTTPEWDSSTPESREPGLLRQACEAGSIGRARAALERFRTKYPDYERLDIFSHSCSAACRSNHPGLLYYICQYIPAYILPDFVLDTKSTAILEVFLVLGWGINWATFIAFPSILGHVVEDECLTRWLLQAGADPNARCRWDYTPMSCAMIHGSMETIKLLLSWGADISRGQLLHHAMWREQKDVLDLIDLLLFLGMDIDALQYVGDRQSWMDNHKLGLGTPLHCAAACGRGDLVEHLLLRGADASLKDSIGRLPYVVALSKGHIDIAERLYQKKAKIVQ